MGTIQSATDSSNRLLWYVEYATIDVESLSYAISSSYAIRLQFLQYEHMLRLVNKQEEKTGQLSGLRHIIDLTGYEINPFTMIFVTNGSLAYYSQLFHFENYPELVSPIEMVNISKWIHVPYRLAKGMMPTGFVERFRLHDADFLRALQKDIKMEDIPTSLGGKNEHIRCVPAAKLASDMHWKPNSPDFLDTLEKIQLAPRKVRQISIDITESNQHLAWYFSTDGDMCFGIFYQETEGLQGTSNVSINSHTENDIDIDKLKMVYPYLKLSARLVHEYDSIKCTRAGRYWMILSNKLSWLHRRTINLCIKVADETFSNVKRYHTDGTFNNVKSFEMKND